MTCVVLHHYMKQQSVILVCPLAQAAVVVEEPFLKLHGFGILFAGGKIPIGIKELYQLECVIF